MATRLADIDELLRQRTLKTVPFTLFSVFRYVLSASSICMAPAQD